MAEFWYSSTKNVWIFTDLLDTKLTDVKGEDFYDHINLILQHDDDDVAIISIRKSCDNNRNILGITRTKLASPICLRGLTVSRETSRLSWRWIRSQKEPAKKKIQDPTRRRRSFRASANNFQFSKTVLYP